MDTNQQAVPPLVQPISDSQADNTKTPHWYRHPFAIILQKTPKGTLLRMDYHEGTEGKPFSKAINIEKLLSHAEGIAQERDPRYFVSQVIYCADDTFIPSVYFFDRDGIRRTVVSENDRFECDDQVYCKETNDSLFGRHRRHK